MGGLRKFMPSTYRTFLLGHARPVRHLPVRGLLVEGRDPLGRRSTPTHLPGHMFLYGVGTLVAGLTAFYMGRALHRDVPRRRTAGRRPRGRPRARAAARTGAGGHGAHDAAHAGAHAPHESPAVMTMPLWFLAIFAVVIGFVGDPGQRRRARAATGSSTSSHAWTHATRAQFHLNVALISTVVALARPRPRVAHLPHGRGPHGRPAARARLGGLHRIWRNLYYVDAFYALPRREGPAGHRVGLLALRAPRDHRRRRQRHVAGRPPRSATACGASRAAASPPTSPGSSSAPSPWRSRSSSGRRPPVNILLAILLLPAAAVLAIFAVPAAQAAGRQGDRLRRDARGARRSRSSSRSASTRTRRREPEPRRGPRLQARAVGAVGARPRPPVQARRRRHRRRDGAAHRAHDLHGRLRLVLGEGPREGVLPQPPRARHRRLRRLRRRSTCSSTTSSTSWPSSRCSCSSGAGAAPRRR